MDKEDSESECCPGCALQLICRKSITCMNYNTHQYVLNWYNTQKYECEQRELKYICLADQEVSIKVVSTA